MHCSSTRRFTLKKDRSPEPNINFHNLKQRENIYTNMVCSPTQNFSLKKDRSIDIEMNIKSNNI